MKEKNKNWFSEHKVLTAIIAFVVLIAIVGVSGGSDNSKPDNSSQASSSPAKTTKTKHVKKPAVRKVKGKATTLGAGTFTGGKDVVVGLYDVTPSPGQSGNFIVNDGSSYNEILGTESGGVSKVRVKISKGDKIQISGLSIVSFTPVKTPFVTSHKKTKLYAGTFVVGEDVGQGRYKVTPGPGQSGNFIVNDGLSYNEILGSSAGGVSSVSVDLQNGDKISISGLGVVTFTPSS